MPDADLITKAIRGEISDTDLATLHPAYAEIIRSFMPRPRLGQHEAPSRSLSPALDADTLWVREWLAELGDRMRACWTEHFNTSRTLRWIETEASDDDILAIPTISSAGRAMALDRRSRAQLQRRIAVERPLANLRASAERARELKQLKDEARWAELDRTDPKEARRLKTQREHNRRRRTHRNA